MGFASGIEERSNFKGCLRRGGGGKTERLSRRRGGQAKLRQAVLLGLEEQLDCDLGAAVKADRLVEGEYSGVVFPGLSANGPARAWVAVDRLVELETRLLETGRHGLQLQRHRLAVGRGDERRCRDLQRGESKPAVLASARPAAGGRRACERFEPQASEALLIGAEGECVAIIALELAGGSDRIPRLFQQRGLRCLERLRFEHLPGGRLLPDGVAS